MTKREMFVKMLDVVAGNEEMVEFINHEISLLDKKSSSARKPTKTQIENDGFKATIVSYLATADAPKSIKELQSEIAELGGLTNQRITHLLTDLVKANTLVKDYVKKTPYYAIKG